MRGGRRWQDGWPRRDETGGQIVAVTLDRYSRPVAALARTWWSYYGWGVSVFERLHRVVRRNE